LIEPTGDRYPNKKRKYDTYQKKRARVFREIRQR